MRRGQFDHGFQAINRVRPFDEEEIAALVDGGNFIAHKRRVGASIKDPVSGFDHNAAGPLAKDVLQAGDREGLAANDIVEDIAAADAGQLIGIADEEDVRIAGNGPDEGAGEVVVEHAGLVDDDKAGFEWILRVYGEAAPGGVELEEAMDGRRMGAGGLGHTLGGSTRGRREEDLHFLRGQNVDERAQNGRLAGAGTPGENRHLGRECLLHGVRLFGGEGKARLVLRPLHGDIDLDRGQAASDVVNHP